MEVSRRRYREGYNPSWWMGFSYTRFNLDVDVLFPIPLNVAVRTIRETWFWLRFKCQNDIKWGTARIAEANRAGFEEGIKVGKIQGEAQVDLRLQSIEKRIRHLIAERG